MCRHFHPPLFGLLDVLFSVPLRPHQRAGFFPPSCKNPSFKEPGNVSFSIVTTRHVRHRRPQFFTRPPLFRLLRCAPTRKAGMGRTSEVQFAVLLWFLTETLLGQFTNVALDISGSLRRKLNPVLFWVSLGLFIFHHHMRDRDQNRFLDVECEQGFPVIYVLSENIFLNALVRGENRVGVHFSFRPCVY